MDHRKQLGQSGETLAASFLMKRGIHILEKNYRCKYGEIDLIGMQDHLMLVVEVKRRSSNHYGLPCETVTYRKQKRICATYNYYRMCHHLNDFTPVRFDVIEIYADGRIRWIKNAFDYVGWQ